MEIGTEVEWERQTELDLQGEADLAQVGEEKTKPTLRGGRMLKEPCAVWDWHQSG